MSRDSLGPARVAATTTTEDDPRLVAALEEYLGQLKSGRRPDRLAFLARHAEIADALAECLDGMELVQSAARNLSSGGGARPAPADDALAPATVLGDFRIGREIGRGGMGVVYEAEQVSLGRRVALKVLPLAAALDPRQRQRFHVEAQAAAHLHHTHIVPIFAVGHDRGAHYYAMQYIEGRTLADLIAEMRRIGRPRGGDDFHWAVATGEAAGPPGSTAAPGSGAARPAASGASTSPSQRGRAFFRMVAQVGVQAAEALEHAHGLGVLHRDVKPSNLMVDERGAVWVADFGLARFLDDPGLTRTGDLVGTLRYMSPEQARARHGLVDQRTDVYALGATLYELATLRPAFDGRDRHEILRQLAQDDPPAPRRVEPSLPRDLETILLKALAKEPAARYASAGALADDLRRFLDARPVQARRPTLPDQVAKWARRHRAIVATAAVVLVAALAVGSALVWREKQRTDAARADLEQNLRRLRDATQLTYRYMDGTTYPLMGKAAYGGLLGGEEGRRAYEQAVALYDGFADSFGDEPALLPLAASARRRAGFFRMILQDRRAEDDYRRSIDTYRRLNGGAVAAGPYRVELAATLAELGNWLWTFHRRPEAERALRESLHIAGRLADEAPDDVERLSALVDETARHAGRLESAGRGGEAEALRRELAERARVLARGPFPTPALARRRARTLDALGDALLNAGWCPTAAEAFESALRVLPNDVAAANGLAWVLAARPDLPPHDPSRAAALARQAIESQPNSAAYWNTLGVAELRLGHLDAAAEALEKSAQLDGEEDGTNDLFLALIRRRQGRPIDARRHFDRASAWLAAAGRDRLRTDPDLAAFRREAEAALGLAPAARPVPAGGAPAG